MKKTLLILGLMVLASCTDEDGSMRALRSAGYRNIQLGGHSFFGCSDDDGASNKFTAIGADGRMVTGQVCCGGPMSFKGCTIRLD